MAVLFKKKAARRPLNNQLNVIYFNNLDNSDKTNNTKKM